MMAKILKVDKKNSMKAAIDLGIAMQLTNISRDVVEDANNNRFYIKYDFENIKKTLRIADIFYESSFNSIKKIPFTFRFAILVARRIYKKIGDNILQKRNIDNYNKSGKIYVSNFSKLFETFLSIYDLILLSFTNEKSHLREEEHLLIKEEINLEIGRAHVWTPVTDQSRMPSSAWKKKTKNKQNKQERNKSKNKRNRIRLA